MKAATFILVVALGWLGLGDVAASVAWAQARSATIGQTFATADAAVDALVQAMRQDRPDKLQAVLGPGSAPLVNSGDSYGDKEARRRFLATYDESHALVESGPDRMIIEVGNQHWPLPIPLVRAAGRWRFDSKQGAQELINRRIGRNEVAAISTALAYVEAQKAFFALTAASGQGHYASRFVSSPGAHDGLYWASGDGEPESPFAALAARVEQEGYPLEPRLNRQLPYQGYLFRILTAQGPAASGGARSYVRGDGMTDGFALIAWPVSYGVSGVMTFVVNQDGVIFQKNLSQATATAASRISSFDPDLSWTRVDLTDQ